MFCIKEPMSRPWCSFTIPSIYSFVQSHYWNNGFLKYFTLQQLPNFILAAPMILFSIHGIYEYIIKDPKRFLSLGYLSSKEKGSPSGPQILPHVYLWSVLIILCGFFMHVQVLQRFLAPYPIIYWHAAKVIKMVNSRWIVYYLVMYNFVACILFSKFYPPA